MSKETAKKAKAAPEFDAGKFLADHSGEVFDAEAFMEALEEAGCKTSAQTAMDMFEAAEVVSLGNDTENVYRFKVAEQVAGGEFWCRVMAGYASGIKVAGLLLDSFGKLVKLTAETRAALEAPDVPVEVISDPGEIAKLTAEAQKRAAVKSQVHDKKAATLEAFA